MATKKAKKTENERYYINLSNDWSVDFSFGINIAPRLISSKYMDRSTLVINGNISYPILKHSQITRITIHENMDYDEGINEDNSRIPYAIGFMEIERGTNVLNMYCWIPPFKLQNFLLSLKAQKINYASVFGTKIKRRKGDIFSIELSTYSDND